MCHMEILASRRVNRFGNEILVTWYGRLPTVASGRRSPTASPAAAVEAADDAQPSAYPSATTTRVPSTEPRNAATARTSLHDRRCPAWVPRRAPQSPSAPAPSRTPAFGAWPWGVTTPAAHRRTAVAARIEAAGTKGGGGGGRPSAPRLRTDCQTWPLVVVAPARMEGVAGVAGDDHPAWAVWGTMVATRGSPLPPPPPPHPASPSRRDRTESRQQQRRRVVPPPPAVSPPFGRHQSCTTGVTSRTPGSRSGWS